MACAWAYRFRDRLSRKFQNILFACLIAAAAPLAAAAPSVALFVGESSGPVREVAEAARNALSLAAGDRFAVTLSTPREGVPANADLVVAVGSRAADTLPTTDVPVLHALIAKSAFEALQRRRPGADSRRLSAIFVDQPWSRQLGLVRLMLPDKKRVGVLLGPNSSEQYRALQAAVRDAGLQLRTEGITDSGQLVPALRRLLEETDLLLAVPDAVAMSRDTAQPVLLTAYRYLKPVFGFSNAYVKAGALAAVYSSPEQIAQHIAETVLQAASASWQLPPPRFPKYFSVGVNAQVGRSLGIVLEAEGTLADKLRRME